MTFKWTAPRTWVAGEKPPAATLNDHIRNNLEALNGYVRKTADESVTSSTTLQNDDHLLWTIPQAGSYAFEVSLIVVSAANAAGDISLGFTFPTGTLYWGAQGLDETLAANTAGQMRSKADTDAASPTTSGFPFGASTADSLLRVSGLLVATASGTLQFQWAQNASNASATTVKTGSFMTVKQVA